MSKAADYSGKCMTCKHWEENSRKLAQAQVDDPDRDGPPWMGGECSGILHGKNCIDVHIYGNGSLESINTDAEFGCVCWEKVE